MEGEPLRVQISWRLLATHRTTRCPRRLLDLRHVIDVPQPALRKRLRAQHHGARVGLLLLVEHELDGLPVVSDGTIRVAAKRVSAEAPPDPRGSPCFDARRAAPAALRAGRAHRREHGRDVAERGLIVSAPCSTVSARVGSIRERSPAPRPRGRDSGGGVVRPRSKRSEAAWRCRRAPPAPSATQSRPRGCRRAAGSGDRRGPRSHQGRRRRSRVLSCARCTCAGSACASLAAARQIARPPVGEEDEQRVARPARRPQGFAARKPAAKPEPECGLCASIALSSFPCAWARGSRAKATVAVS